MMKEDWIERLRHRMADHQETPPEGLWDDIEKSLPPVTTPHAGHTIIMRRLSVAAAVTAVLATGAFYLWNSNQNGIQPTSTIAQKPSTEQESNPKQIADASAVAKSDNDISIENVVRVLRHKTSMTEPIDGQDTYMRITEVMVGPNYYGEEEADDEDTYTEKKKEYKQEKKSGSGVASSNDNYYASTSDYSNHNISLNLYAANTMIGKNNSNGVIASGVMSMYDSPNIVMSRAMSTYLKDYKEETKHHQPISFGLSVGYGLSQRLSISTGVVYSKVTTDFTRVMEQNKLVNTQALHYVGIPVNLNYNVWGTSNLKVYVGAGGQADINVAAQMTSEGKTVKTDKDRVQWSANAAAGVQYDIIPRVGVYVEPGVKYYFDNKSNVENIFKEKPLNFNMQLGVRINLK